MTKTRNFDLAALNWDEEPRRVKLAEEIAEAIKKNIEFQPGWDGLDIGCGTGLVTLQLAPLLREITGMDSSSGMLDKLSEKIKQGGLANISTVLCDPSAGMMPNRKYDFIASAMMLHHIQEVEPLICSIKNMLHSGGRIALADFEAEDGSFHDDPTGVFHHGFNTKELVMLLERCGFSEVSIITASKVIKGERSYPVFLATASLL